MKEQLLDLTKNGFYAIRYGRGVYADGKSRIESETSALYDRLSKSAIEIPNISNFSDKTVGMLTLLINPGQVKFLEDSDVSRLEDLITGKKKPETEASLAQYNGYSSYSGYLAYVNCTQLGGGGFNGIRKAMSDAKKQRDKLKEKVDNISIEFEKLQNIFKSKLNKIQPGN